MATLGNWQSWLHQITLNRVNKEALKCMQSLGNEEIPKEKGGRCRKFVALFFQASCVCSTCVLTYVLIRHPHQCINNDKNTQLQKNKIISRLTSSLTSAAAWLPCCLAHLPTLHNKATGVCEAPHSSQNLPERLALRSPTGVFWRGWGGGPGHRS